MTPSAVTNIEVKPNLSRVVVYKSNAQLNFACGLAGTTFAAGGEYAIRVDGSWKAKDQKSLQATIKGTGADNILMRAVRFRQVRSVDDLRPRVRELEAVLEDLRTALVEKEDALEATSYRIACVKQVLHKFSHAGSRMLPSDAYDPMKWVELSEMGRRQLVALDAQRREQVMMLAAHKKEVERVSFELKSVTGRGGNATNYERETVREVAEIIVSVEGNHPVDGTELILELSYLVSNASWEPIYDVRVDSVSQEVSLTYSAIIKQTTVAEWANVEIQLSTASPQLGGDPPQLAPWRIDIDRPLNSRRDQAQFEEDDDECEEGVAEGAKELALFSAKNKSRSRAPAAKTIAPAKMEMATVTNSATTTAFNIPGRHTVANGGESVKVGIAVLPLRGEFEYVCVPKMKKSTFLQVRCINSSPFSLLPGRSNIFGDNQLIGTAAMDLVSPGEDFYAHLGIDDSVEVERTEVGVKEIDTSSFISGKRTTVEFRYCYSVKNTRPVPTTTAAAEEGVGMLLRLTVRDQYPLSEDRDCVVSVLEPKIKKSPSSGGGNSGQLNKQPFSYTSVGGDGTSALVEPLPAVGASSVTASRGTVRAPPVTSTVETTETHEIVWSIENLAPGEQRMFNYVFAVEYPTEMDVSGL